MKKIIPNLIFFLIAGLFVHSCIGSQKDLPEPEVDLTAEKDHSTNESDLMSIQAAINAYYNSTSGCGITTLNSDTLDSIPGFGINYRKFTIDFAASPHCINDTITRRGQIVVYYSGNYLINTLKDSAVLVGYSISGRNMKGYILRTSLLSTSPDKEFTFHAIDTITFPGGSTFVWNATRTSTYNTTAKTTTLSGSSSGMDRNGNKFTSSISINSNIVFDQNCPPAGVFVRWPKNGILSFTNTTRNIIRTIDYGNGVCDSIATYTSPKGNISTFIME